MGVVEMGRTVPSYRDVIDSELNSLKKYRSALRKGDQEIWVSFNFGREKQQVLSAYSEVN